MRAIDSAIVLSKTLNNAFHVMWYQVDGLSCRFDELFVVPRSMTKLTQIDQRTRIGNFIKNVSRQFDRTRFFAHQASLAIHVLLQPFSGDSRDERDQRDLYCAVGHCRKVLRHTELPTVRGKYWDKARVYVHVTGDTREILVQGCLDAKAKGFPAVGHLTPFLDESRDVAYFKTHAGATSIVQHAMTELSSEKHTSDIGLL